MTYNNIGETLTIATANPVLPPSSNLPQLTEFPKLEHHFLRVLFEHYKKTLSANLYVVEKEMFVVIFNIIEVVTIRVLMI